MEEKHQGNIPETKIKIFAKKSEVLPRTPHIQLTGVLEGKKKNKLGDTGMVEEHVIKCIKQNKFLVT